MKRNNRLLSAVFAALFLVLPLFAKEAPVAKVSNDNDIVVLYTNDVHCGINGDVGYAGLVAYRNDVLSSTPYVITVDNGDAIQGDVIGTISKGDFIVDIMNKAGFDLAILGNHEFDYGMDQLKTLVEKSKAQYLAANITYKGKKSSTFLDSTVPYVIKEFGNKKVAFIGLSTPQSIATSTPTYFMENGKFVYDFAATKLYSLTQKLVDKARKEGADYVVILSHLGDEDVGRKDSSRELIKNTTGIDVVLDGHSHSVIPQEILTNKKGEKVLLTSTGTKFQYLGKLTISKDGEFASELVDKSYTKKDAGMTSYIAEVQAQCDKDLKKVVASIDIDLTTKAPNGARMIRNREMAIGDLCADAYRNIAQTDIAFVNGGGIRTDLKKGDVTYADVIAVHPFGNMLTSCKATGQQILDLLEASCRLVESVQSTEDGKPVGELGGFQQVSGIKFTVDTSIPSSVVMDDKNMFAGVKGERRVKDVMVLDGDKWVPINPSKTYTVASHNYLIKSGGDGLNMFVKDELIIDSGMLDNQVLITYLKDVLEGNVSALYSEPQGRITTK